MKIWFFASSHPLPRQSVAVRPGRMRVLAESLATRGHAVAFFSSNFHHGQKTHYQDWLPQHRGVRYHAVSSPGYRRHISARRIYEHRVVARRVAQQAMAMAAQDPKGAPDLIFCNWPTLDMAAAARRVAWALDAKLVIGVSDLWPDSFVSLAPARLRPMVGLYTRLLQPRTHRLLAAADAVSGLTGSYLAWAQRKAGGARAHDFVLPMTYEAPAAADRAAGDAKNAAMQDTDTKETGTKETGIKETGIKDIDLVYSGVAGNNFDRPWTRDFIAALLAAQPGLKIAFAGTGPAMDLLRTDFAGTPQVTFLGFLEPEALYDVLGRARLGLLGYQNIENFRLNLPNKVSEYAAFSLPMVNAIPGEIAAFIERFDCGINAVGQSGAQAAVQAAAFLADAPRRAQTAANARQGYETLFNPERNAAELERCLARIVAA